MPSVSWSSFSEFYLSKNLYETAKFYAERAYYEDRSPTHLYQLAQCYYRLGKVKQTYLILQETVYSSCQEAKYLFAQTCLALGKLTEAEAVLVDQPAFLSLDSINANQFSSTPGGAAGVYLLGVICKRQQRLEFAQRYLLTALQMDPYLWEAITELSEMGVEEPMEKVLQALQSTSPPAAVTTAAAPLVQAANRTLRSQKPPLEVMHSPSTTQLQPSVQKTYSLVEQLTPGSSVALGLSTMPPQPSMGSKPYGYGEQVTPGTSVAMGLSTMSLQPPYTCTPNSVPSPISRSMLSVSQQEEESVMQSKTRPRALFGGPTPSNPNTGSAAVDPLLTSSSAISMAGMTATNTVMHPQGHAARENSRHGERRVSFGPSARLSFSGAFDAGATAIKADSGLYSPIFEQGEVSYHHLSGLNLSNVHPMETTPPPPPTVVKKRPMATGRDVSKYPNSENASTQLNGDHFRTMETIGEHEMEAQEDVEVVDLAKLQQILLTYAKAVQLLYNYHSLECIDALNSLPEKHLRSGLTCQLLAKAYLDMNDYKVAVLLYRNMLQHEAFRLQGIEYYSTALWHLKKEKELSALAQQVYEVDKYSPETYCTLGNFFSLIKDTDSAIKHFNRALSLDPHFFYAYTLAGHEYISNDNVERAIDYFNHALLNNHRHYNAYYGLGSICYKQEKYEQAEYYFKTARSINSRSSVLDCYYAMALSAQGHEVKIAQALQVLELASERDPNNPQLRFQRAHILLSQDAAEEALEELLIVEDVAPQEPPVHALLGQVYQRLGRFQEAFNHLNIAMDLDPKEAHALKVIMDSLEEPPGAI